MLLAQYRIGHDTGILRFAVFRFVVRCHRLVGVSEIGIYEGCQLYFYLNMCHTTFMINLIITAIPSTNATIRNIPPRYSIIGSSGFIILFLFS